MKTEVRECKKCGQLYELSFPSDNNHAKNGLTEENIKQFEEFCNMYGNKGAIRYLRSFIKRYNLFIKN